MTQHDDPMEQLLRKYQPAGPSEDFRQRIFASIQHATEPPRTRRGWVIRTAAVAAVIALAVGLRVISNMSFMAAIFATPGKGF
jgi:hypothetical protein